MNYCTKVSQTFHCRVYSPEQRLAFVKPMTTTVNIIARVGGERGGGGSAEDEKKDGGDEKLLMKLPCSAKRVDNVYDKSTFGCTSGKV